MRLSDVEFNDMSSVGEAVFFDLAESKFRI